MLVEVYLAFNESSGVCLTRSDGNNPTLQEIAVKNAQALAYGHTFVLVLAAAYPINLLNAIRNVPEVCFCATANPVEILETEKASPTGQALFCKLAARDFLKRTRRSASKQPSGVAHQRPSNST
jgi:adenosine/AMP kinase